MIYTFSFLLVSFFLLCAFIVLHKNVDEPYVGRIAVVMGIVGSVLFTAGSVGLIMS